MVNDNTNKTKDILKKYSGKYDLIPALQAIQDNLGYLPKKELEKISKSMKIPLVNIYGVATFYSMFKFKPKGKYNISICRGTACHVHNSDHLLKYLEKKLNIKAGETTKDTKFSIETVNCIGACAKAPAIMINEEVYGNMDEKKIDELLSKLK